MSNIFIQSKYIDPEYQHLDKYVQMGFKSFWTPARYESNIRDIDVPYIENTLGEVDRSAIVRCILAVATVEDKVKTFWSALNKDIPQTVIGEVGGVFGNMEVIHARSYRALIEFLGLRSELNSIEKYPIIADRLAYLNKYNKKQSKTDPEGLILKKLVLFTSLVERASLFSQFYILMSYAHSNRGLKNISSLQRSTIKEELMHYEFGIDVINIIKGESPHLWDERLERLVSKELNVAYNTEKELIDWFFELGVPEHLTKEEVMNFLNYNFNTILKDLDLPEVITYDKELFEEKNNWLLVQLKTTSEPDFFNSSVGDYSSIEIETDYSIFN